MKNKIVRATPATSRKRKLQLEEDTYFCTPKRRNQGGQNYDRYQKNELLNYCRAHNLKIESTNSKHIKKTELIASIRKADRQAQMVSFLPFKTFLLLNSSFQIFLFVM